MVTTTRYNYQIEVALLVSALLHALPLGMYQARHVLARVPLLNQVVRVLTEPRARVAPVAPVIPQITFVEAPEPPPPPGPVLPPPAPRREPNVFMETHEEQAADTRPADTQFYGTRNTVAANPENPTNKSGETPYLEGDQDRLLAARTVTLPIPALVTPPPPPPVAPPAGGAAARDSAGSPPAPRVPPEPEKPKEVPAEGLAQAEPPQPEPRKPAPLGAGLSMLGGPDRSGSKPAVVPTPTPAAPAVISPGRAGGDLARSKSRLVAAGVDRRGVAAFNVAESPFGAYDREIILAVQSRWLANIEKYGIYEQAGTVTLYFELYEDGSVRNLSRKTNTGGEMAALWCEKAIAEAAPFEALPENLRLLLGGQPRDVTFTFYY